MEKKNIMEKFRKNMFMDGQYLFFEIKPEFETVLNININYNVYMTKLISK